MVAGSISGITPDISKDKAYETENSITVPVVSEEYAQSDDAFYEYLRPIEADVFEPRLLADIDELIYSAGDTAELAATEVESIEGADAEVAEAEMTECVVAEAIEAGDGRADENVESAADEVVDEAVIEVIETVESKAVELLEKNSVETFEVAEVSEVDSCEETFTYCYSEDGYERGLELVAYATQFVGNPYVWGGTSLTSGADCSGFTMTLYGMYGVELPHSSLSQATYGTAVDGIENAQPGDLIVYNGHVAIYIGDGQIVHAANSRLGICITGIDFMDMVGIRRLF